MKNKRLILILASLNSLLLIPLIAMQFSTEVDWNSFDFFVMGALLSITGLGIELILRSFKSMKYRIASVLILGFVFLLIWAELAVGIFGSPFAGS